MPAAALCRATSAVRGGGRCVSGSVTRKGISPSREWRSCGIRYAPLYLSGVVNTLLLAVAATVLGCLIGLACGLLNTIPIHPQDRLPRRVLLRLLRAVIRIYVEVFRGTPMVLQAVFLYYGLPYFTNNAMRFDNVWAAALLVVSINTGAYMAESVRGGILSVDPGQTEGAKAIGMSHVQTMVNVILPQALRNIMPQIGNNFIINVKDTSVMFIIGFTEFFAAHRYITGVNPMYFPSAAIEMLGYLCMTLAASAPAAAGGAADGRGEQLRAGPGRRPDHDRRHLPPPAPPPGRRGGADMTLEPILEVCHLSKSFGTQPGPPGCELHCPPRRCHQHSGLLRLRQVHPAAVHQPAGAPQSAGRSASTARPITGRGDVTPPPTGPRWGWSFSLSTSFPI